MKPEKIEELERLHDRWCALVGNRWKSLADVLSPMQGHVEERKAAYGLSQAVPELIREVRRLQDDLRVMRNDMHGHRRRAEQAESESKRLSVALANVSGALADAGTVDVPEDVTEYGKAVRGVVRERDRAESESARWKSDRDMYEAEIARHGGRRCNTPACNCNSFHFEKCSSRISELVAESKSLQFVIDTTVKAMKGEELTKYEMGVALAQDAVEIIRERDRALGMVEKVRGLADSFWHGVRLLKPQHELREDGYGFDDSTPKRLMYTDSKNVEGTYLPTKAAFEKIEKIKSEIEAIVNPAGEGKTDPK
jgi:hypothetical protein